MRLLLLASAVALAACSTSMSIGGGASGAAAAGVTHQSAWPFPVERGSALPPPQAGAAQSPPPEGRTPGGVDFGHWRSADIATYSGAFATQMTAREQGRDGAAIRADLEANGFACENGARLDCRIEITDNQCPQDWYVVLDGGELHAGYEKACGLGRS